MSVKSMEVYKSIEVYTTPLCLSIYCGVEVTELSTNTQHTLSIGQAM